MKAARAVLLGATLASTLALAQTHPPHVVVTSPQHGLAIKLDVRRSKLDNGLRVVLAPDHTSPTIAVDVIYDVGGRNEERGHAGFAHLFEHMMFQGSANVAARRALQARHEPRRPPSTARPARTARTTSRCSRAASSLSPSGSKPTACARSTSRRFNFENQRKVVEEEFRMRVSNARLRAGQHSLETAGLPGLLALRAPGHRQHAGSRRCTARLGQDVPRRPLRTQQRRPRHRRRLRSRRGHELVRRYFGPAAAQSAIPPYNPVPFPKQKAPRDAIIEDAHAQLPAIMLGWAIPPLRDTGSLRARARSPMLLADGESSRL